jgi:hypothetical protein
MEVDEDTWVATAEIYTLREEHWRIAMSIERENTPMEVAGATIVSSLLDEPGEDGGTIFRGHTLRVPLNTKDALILTTLYCLDDAISRTGCHAETFAWVADGLMMERVDIQSFLIIYIK